MSLRPASTCALALFFCCGGMVSSCGGKIAADDVTDAIAPSGDASTTLDARSDDAALDPTLDSGVGPAPDAPSDVRFVSDAPIAPPAGGWVVVTADVATDLVSVAAVGPTEAWAVGDGALVHAVGAAATRDPGVPSGAAVYGVRSDDVWVVGHHPSHLLHWDGGGWSAEEVPSNSPGYTDGVVTGVAGNGTSGVWAFGYDRPPFPFYGNRVWHREGAAWSDLAVPVKAGSSGVVNGPLSVSAGDELWVGTGGDTWRLRHGAFVPTSAGREIYALSVTSATSVWALAGETTTKRVLHFDGSVWAETPTQDGARDYAALWSAEGEGLWAVGAMGKPAIGFIAYYDGAHWTDWALPAAVPPLHAIVGDASRSIWAVGARGAILHWVPAPG